MHASQLKHLIQIKSTKKMLKHEKDWLYIQKKLYIFQKNIDLPLLNENQSNYKILLLFSYKIHT